MRNIGMTGWLKDKISTLCLSYLAFLAAVAVVLLMGGIKVKAAEPDYLTFSSSKSFTLATRNNAKNWNGALEYSMNGGSSWSTWNGTSAISVSANTKLLMRGTGNTVITGGDYNYRWVLTGNNISCSGNIETLLDYSKVNSGQHPTMANRCYMFMFSDCTSLIQAPALPAMTLASECYRSMFSDCTSLIQAPALPATTLSSSCYHDMFYNCTSLTQAPALPATTLAGACYFRMFYTCTSLTQAPALPATTLANNCYGSMFYDCTSLTQAPALPATTLASSCYSYMFQSCTALKFSASKTGEYQYPYRIPVTGSGTTASSWNSGMFSGTGGTFTSDPAVNTTYYTTAPVVYNYVSFSSPSSFTLKTGNTTKNWDGTLQYSTNNGSSWSTWDGTTTISVNANTQLLMRGSNNTKITGGYIENRWVLTGSNILCSGNIETLLDYSKVNSGQHPNMIKRCYASMFQNCTSLTQAPALPATTLAECCYTSMFYGCTSLTQAPALPATTLAEQCYLSMFYGCTSLTQVPALSATTLAEQCYHRMFSGCTSLTQAPALPATTLAYNCYYEMFSGCTSLAQAPALPATTLASQCYYRMFYNCTSLTQAPALPATTLAWSCYQAMFSGCTSLKQAPALPATTLANYCYGSMFYNCTSLTQAPALSAMTLASGCYRDMFKGCTSLKFSETKTGDYRIPYRIPTEGDGVEASDWNTSMFADTGGTFTGDPVLGTTYYMYKPYDADDFANVGDDHITFKSDEAFTLKVNDTTAHWDGALAYSLDNGSTWTIWDGSEISVSSGKKLFMAGVENTVITGSSYSYKWVLTGSNISCSGNIETLLDYSTVNSGQHPTMTNYCYQYMFQGCTSLTQAPALPATTLTNYCYNDMFNGCTSLEQAPALPAATLASYCYNGMFADCTSLIQAPALSATTLADSCYSSMFSGCTALTQTLALPATTLASYCYNGMFSGCTALTQAPALPATTLANYCYSDMFNGCTSLTQAPALPATTLVSYCYQNMFKGCTSLTQAPVLPATTLASNCYAYMFENCKSLIQAPALPATTLVNYCYDHMFYNCTSLTQAPALPATTMTTGCYRYMFNGCTSLKFSETKTGEYRIPYRIPAEGDGVKASSWNYGMFASTGGTFTGDPVLGTTYYMYKPYDADDFANVGDDHITFESDSGAFTLKVNDTTKHWDGGLAYSLDNGSTWTIWDGSEIEVNAGTKLFMAGVENTLITGSNQSGNYKWILTGSDISCSGNIETLLDYSKVNSSQHPTMASYCYSHMFEGCTSLTQAPALPATTLASSCYSNMFYGCTALTQAPALPATTLAGGCYSSMFEGCTSLTQAPALPATTLASSCYSNMFYGCTSLTQAPALPATTLANYCYQAMFEGCISLTQAPALPATTLKNSCYSCMFQGCTSLTSAPVLPATQMANYCYRYMFDGCASLTQAPALRAVILEDSCYNSMFSGCTALTQAPVLPATILASNCYNSMFKGCTALTQAPALPATTLKTYCYRYMFQNCTSLEQAPALPATTLANYCYNSMFSGCTSLKFSETKTSDYRIPYRIPTEGDGVEASSWNTNMFADTGGTFTGDPVLGTTYYMFKPYAADDFANVGDDHITFESDGDFTLKVNDTTAHWDGALAYSLDNGSTWTIWDGSEIEVNAGTKLFMAGVGNTVITGSDSNYRWVLTGSNVSCSGNIETLLDYVTVNAGNHPTMADHCYHYMFAKCEVLCEAPVLPAITLVPYCYCDMFWNCTSLTQAPVLLATTLAESCYQWMFEGCTSLIQAPALPATTLGSECYSNMFEGCTSLTQAPELPATTLAYDCYYQMFYGCRSLTQAPALPATTLAYGCYYSMFIGCTSLTQAPALPATTLADYCYGNMFINCTSLTQAPALPAATLTSSCYNSMFQGCTSLTQAPALPAMTLAESCYNSMFQGCTSLMEPPALPATTLVRYCYQYMFSGCTSLKFSASKTGEYQYPYQIPTIGSGTEASSWNIGMLSGTGGTFTGNPAINTTYYTPAPLVYTYLSFSSPGSFTLETSNNAKNWDGMLEYSTDGGSSWSTWTGTSAISVPANTQLLIRGTNNTRMTGTIGSYRWVLTGSNISCSGNIETLLDYPTVNSGQHPTMANYCYGSMFKGCTSLIQAPALPATDLTKHCYDYMFNGCTSLTGAPALSATTLADYCYSGMFRGCTSLVQAPALPAMTLASDCYSYMFSDCTALTQVPVLPAMTLASECYLWMFYNCTSLIQAPDLSATTLASNCYKSMFQNCTSLMQAPVLPATTLANNCYDSMFNGCTSLTQAPALLATTLADNCYRYMFQNCTSLTQAPALLATTLKSYCYYFMFSGCTSLVQAPALPATTLADNCYNSMFSDCTSLTQAPALPATTLKSYCYYYMFYNCTSLIQAPVLLATTLANNCYDSMFNGCTSLTKASALPATTLASYCYRYMFKNCTSLTQAPALPATTLASNCYKSMFQGCTSLALSETRTNEYCYPYRIPESGIGTIASGSLSDMFSSTGGTFQGTPEINKTYYLKSKPQYTFAVLSDGESFNRILKSCSLNYDAGLEDLNNTIVQIKWTDEAFTSDYDVSETAPVYARAVGDLDNIIELYSTVSNVVLNDDCSSMFYNMASLEQPSFLSDIDSSGTSDMSRMFAYAKSLSSSTLLSDFDTSAVTDMSEMFFSCNALSSFDAGWDTSSVVSMDRMFGLCDHLTNADLDRFSFAGLASAEDIFMGCNALTAASAPANVPSSVFIKLPANSKYKWYISDGSGEAATTDKYLVFAQGLNEVVTYIRKGKPLSWYTVSVPASLRLTTVDFRNFTGEDHVIVSITSDDPADLVHLSLSDASAASVTVPFSHFTSDTKANLSVTLDDTDFTITSEGMMGVGTKSKSTGLHATATLKKSGNYNGNFVVTYSGKQSYIDRIFNLTPVIEEMGYIYNPVGNHPVIKMTSDGSVVTRLDIPAIYYYNLKPYRIVGIDQSVLKDCLDLVSVTLPDTVTEIGGHAFENCTGLTWLYIPDGIERIGEHAFWNTLTNIVYKGEVYTDPASFNAKLIEDGVAVDGYGNIVTENDGWAAWASHEQLYASYTVEHYQMGTDGNYPDTPFETETGTAAKGGLVTPAVKSYEGFGTPELQTVTVESDGSTVVRYLYPRNAYKQTTYVRLENADGTWGSYSVVRDEDAYYGASYSLDFEASVVDGVPYDQAVLAGYTVTGAKENHVSLYRHTYTLSVVKGEGIYSVFGGGTYRYGQSAVINAVVSDGYDWDGWTGYSTISDQEATVVVTENMSYTANGVVGIPMENRAIKFSSPGQFTLIVSDGTKHWDGDISYSLNEGRTWTVWDGKQITVPAGSDLYMSGTGNTVITGTNFGDYGWSMTGSNISCSGNIETLLDYSTVNSGQHPTMAERCYSNMFKNCTSLIQAPSLPATTLATNCYNSMFNGCTALTKAPALPATTLAEECYSNMFNYCTALTQAPALPATILATNCYNSMFADCKSLTQAPALSATTLANNCYLSMFRGCTSLTQAPALPATTMKDNCYDSMFNGCTVLTKAPALPVTTLATKCYEYMFQNCTSLIQAPALPATTLAQGCYRYMFYGCTSLKISSSRTGAYTYAYRIPQTGSIGTGPSNWNMYMFGKTGGTFTSNPSINTTYYTTNSLVTR